jgi:hypothetical protein
VSGTYRVDEEVEIARITRVAAYTGDIAADSLTASSSWSLRRPVM